MLENLTLPSTTYKKNRHSGFSQRSDTSGNGEEFFIPMALDPNPAPGPSPLARTTQVFELPGEEIVKPQAAESKLASHDYFTPKGPPPSTSNKVLQDYETKHTSLTSNSPRDSRHSSQPGSPHIAYQELGREPHEMVENARKRKDHIPSTSINAVAYETPHDLTTDVRSRPNGEARNGKFLLQEVPKNKKSGTSARNSKSDGLSSTLDTGLSSLKSSSAPASASTQIKEPSISLLSNESRTSVRPSQAINGAPFVTHDGRGQENGLIDSTSFKALQSSPASTHSQNLPRRSDSLVKSGTSKQVTRKELAAGHSATTSTTPSNNGVENHVPASAPSSTIRSQSAASLGTLNESNATANSIDSPSSGSVTEIPHEPGRVRDRDRLVHTGSDSFNASRLPSSLQAGALRAKHESGSTQMSETSRNGNLPASPKLPRYSAGGEFTMDDDMARILGHEEPHDHASFLRRVSSSMRHARSYSDKGTRLSREPKWPKSPLVRSPGISSPTSSSPEAREELMWFKNELRRERQKASEKEQKLLELEATLDAKGEIRQMNTELREKRSTMIVLDTQKEIVVRELEVLTEHIAAAQKSREPLDIGKMSNMVLRDFAEALQSLKDSFAPPIEELTQKRNELLGEVSNLTQMRDKSLQDFEQLSLKNTQLTEFNNHLVHQIQELHKANTNTPSMEIMRPPNGLGIYTPASKDKYPPSLDDRESKNPSIAESNLTGSTAVQEHDPDPATYLTAPQVVNIRKAQPKKFNWKRGGQNVAKGVTKGLKGAFTSNDPHKVNRDGQYAEGTPYGSMQSSQEYPNGNQSRAQLQDRFGFFGNPKGKPPQFKNTPNGVVSTVNPDGIPGKSLFWFFAASID